MEDTQIDSIVSSLFSLAQDALRTANALEGILAALDRISPAEPPGTADWEEVPPINESLHRMSKRSSK